MKHQEQGVRLPYIKPEMQVEQLPATDVIATSIKVQMSTRGKYQSRVAILNDSDWD